MHECKCIYTFPLQSQPDCIKSFPFLDSKEPFLNGSFIVSCYRYDELTRERDGKLSSEDGSFTPPKLYYFAHDLGGILSCSWTRFGNGYGVSCISSDSTVAQFSVDCSHGDSGLLEPTFSSFRRLKLSDGSDSSVALSLSLSDEYAGCMCVTTSNGTAYFVKNNSDFFKWKPHDVETWTSSFHPNDSHIILTGSDDSTVRVFDLKSGFRPVSTVSCHSSGVTSVQFSPDNPNVLYTGGFDKLLVTHDYRNLSKPLHTLQTSTSVWFLDFVTHHDGSLNQFHISGCHDGSSIYTTSGSLVSFFKPANPLIYGTSHLSLSSSLVYCCSDFYNKSLHFYS